MNAWRIRGQDQAEHRRLGLVTHDDAARFHSVAPGQDIEVQPAREAIEDPVHVREHEMVFGHVMPAHVFGQTGRRGLLAGKIRRRLLPIAHGQSGVAIKIGGLLHDLHQFATWNLAQNIAGALHLLHVFGEQTWVGLADLSQRFTGHEMDDLVEFEAFVGLSPAEDGNFYHKCLSQKGIRRLVRSGFTLIGADPGQRTQAESSTNRPPKAHSTVA
jgi:hypothetical protein